MVKLRPKAPVTLPGLMLDNGGYGSKARPKSPPIEVLRLCSSLTHSQCLGGDFTPP